MRIVKIYQNPSCRLERLWCNSDIACKLLHLLQMCKCPIMETSTEIYSVHDFTDDSSMDSSKKTNNVDQGNGDCGKESKAESFEAMMMTMTRTFQHTLCVELLVNGLTSLVMTCWNKPTRCLIIQCLLPMMAQQ